jgi:hypothetical protein
MKLMPSSLRRIAVSCAFAAAFCWPLAAASVSKLNDDVLAPLRGPVVAKRIHINNLPLYAHGTVGIDLEEFQVWAPGGKVIVNDGKSVQYLDPPPMRFFRGLVNGDPESFAYFSIDGATQAIYGLVATRDGKFSVNAARRHPVSREHNTNPARSDDFDYFLTASDESDGMPMTGKTWECAVDKMPALTHINKRMLIETDAAGFPIIAEGITGTQSYAMAVDVETDDELYAAAGNSVSAVTALVTNLTGAVSTIYNRDLHTNVVQQNLHVYSGGPGTDPWTATDALNGLFEIGNYYHTNHLTLKRSAVVMLSGKATLSGVAWEGTIGEGDFAEIVNSVNTYSGGYAWCGSIGDLSGPFTSTVPDPNATTNGTLYGMPAGGNNYWPLAEYAHELGHNLAGHHTHCVAITPLEAAGTNHPTQFFIDMCHTGEVEQTSPNGACATGANYSSAPTEKGTIMSYCHNVFVTGVPQSRFTFGQAAEVSHHELDDYMLRASGPISPYGGSFNIVTAVGTFTMSTITASSTVQANSTGNTASVTSSNGGTPTYAWTITGGTITSASNIASITYTAGASGNVVLRATAYKNSTNGSGFANGGVGITDTKTVTINTCTAPSITAQSSSTSIVTGQTATLTVTASGTATLSYQWYVGNSGNTSSPVGGGTNSSVTVSPASTTSYWVRVTNSCGTADSGTVTVTVTTNLPSVATLFYPVTPCRIIDTRNANGPQGGPALVSGGTRNITVAGVCGIPTGVVAISVNLAVVAPSASGYLTLFTGPSNAPLPLASTINYQTNRTLANNAIVKAGSDTINVYNGGPTVDFVIDVNGYFK